KLGFGVEHWQSVIELLAAAAGVCAVETDFTVKLTEGQTQVQIDPVIEDFVIEGCVQVAQIKVGADGIVSAIGYAVQHKALSNHGGVAERNVSLLKTNIGDQRYKVFEGNEVELVALVIQPQILKIGARTVFIADVPRQIAFPDT